MLPPYPGTLQCVRLPPFHRGATDGKAEELPGADAVEVLGSKVCAPHRPPGGGDQLQGSEGMYARQAQLFE